MAQLAVLGAGQGGCALAAHLTMKGFSVALFNRSEARIKAIRERGGIGLKGVAGEGTFLPRVLTTSIGEALEGSEMIFVTVPAYGQRALAEAMAPHLSPKQAVALLPGYAGSLEFERVWRAKGLSEMPLLGETITLPYGCRFIEEGSVWIDNFFRLRIAAIPGIRSGELFDRAQDYLQLIRAEHVLEVAVRNPNLVIHVPPYLLNLGAIERTQGAINLYDEGMTPMVVKCLEELDGEVMKVMEALGLEALSIERLYNEEFGCGMVFRMDLRKGASREGKWRVQERFITEDVPYGLVFLESLGRALGLRLPLTGALIELASRVMGEDYRAQGRTLERLGLAGLSLQEMMKILMEGGL